MKVYQVKFITKQLLREYAKDGDEFALTIGGDFSNTTKNKKSADSIATGKAKDYSDRTYITKYEKSLPNLARITQDLKIKKPKEAFIIGGQALEELNVLIKAKKPLKKDEKGAWILPMGDNIRLINLNGQFYLKYVGPRPDDIAERKKEQADINNNTTEHADEELLPDLA